MAKRTLLWFGLALAALLMGARAEAVAATWPDGHETWTEDFANAPDVTVNFTGAGPSEVSVEGDFQVDDLVFSGGDDYILSGGSLQGDGQLRVEAGYTGTLVIDTSLDMAEGATI